ncbi:hypothetical protein Tco_1341968, partial [Tanacetum coccineum]
MAMRLLVLISPKWSATTATRGDILLGSAELQEIKTTRRKSQEGVCLWKQLLPQLWCHVMVLVDMTRVIRQRNGLIMHSWLTYLQVLTQSELRKKLEKLQKEKDSIQFNVDKFENAFEIPPPYIRNFMPPTPDLSFTGLDEFVNKPVVENRKSDEEVSKVVRKSDDS